MTASRSTNLASSATLARIRGFCPVCGSHELAVDGDVVVCMADGCPRPTAVTTIIDDPEVEHLVTFDDEGFTIKHPLRERLDDALLSCDLHSHCARLSGPPDWVRGERAVYRARRRGQGDEKLTYEDVEFYDGVWSFEAVSS